MTPQSDQPRQSRMTATASTPWVSASLLAEHTFCPRAGIIQLEAQEEDTGEERPLASRGQPRRYYSLYQIRRDLNKWGIATVVALVVGLIILALVSAARNPAVSLLLYLPVIVFSGCFVSWFKIYYSHYLPAVRAVAQVPDPNHSSSLAVNWWSLLNAGFEPRQPQEGYRDEKWRLVGRPWRILVKGDLRIPVFRKHYRKNSTTWNKVYQQHLARLAAYCYLIEICEGAKSPYGIVLFGDTHKGITVPNQPGPRKVFHDALLATRETISAKGRTPPPPTNTTRCQACPHSWRDRVTKASVCGSRFTWRPPNPKSDELEARYGGY